MSDADRLIQEKINNFLSERRQAIYATNREGGPPQLSPVWFVWKDETLYVSTSAESYKTQNVTADAQVSVCVDGGFGDYRYVAMSGEATVVAYQSELQQEMRWQIIRKYHESDESARTYFDNNADEESVLLVLKPNRIVYKDMN